MEAENHRREQEAEDWERMRAAVRNKGRELYKEHPLIKGKKWHSL